MYLFIFESIGTSELILVGLVALIIFGPRKLPEMLKMFGKTMAEFRRSTNEFKDSWEREVSFENLDKEDSQKPQLLEKKGENSIGRKSYPLENEIVAPEIKEIDQTEFEQLSSKKERDETEGAETEQVIKPNNLNNDLSDKRDWL